MYQANMLALKLLNFLFYTNHITAFVACCLIYFSHYTLLIPINVYLLIFIYSSTIIVYSLERIIKSDKKLLVNYQVILTIQLIIFSLLNIILLQFLSKEACLLLFFLFIICLLYIFKFIPHKKEIKSLDNFIWGKSLLVPFIWSTIIVITPLLENKASLFSFASIYLFIQLFISLSLNMIIFDERDTEIDKQLNIKSLTVCIKRKYIIILALTLYFLSFNLLLICLINFNSYTMTSILFVITNTFLIIQIILSSKKKQYVLSEVILILPIIKYF